MDPRQLQMVAAPAKALDELEFRRVLGHYPTGVCAVTAMDPEIGPIGMTVGSFGSVSLDPPLIAFMPTRHSTTFDRIRRIGTFCVNVLSAAQGDVGRQLARHGAGRFAGISWRLSPAMSPVIEDSLAWIDCEIDQIHAAGDHDIVIGAVTAMDTLPTAGPPLLFFQGGYGRFSTMTLTAVTDDALSGHLVLADVARPFLEQLTQRFDVDCHATAMTGEHLIQVAYSGALRTGGDVSKVGLRLPFLPPMGALFIAWEPASAFEAWLARAGLDGHGEVGAALGEMVADVRRRGWVGTPADARFTAVEQMVQDMAANGPLPVLERGLQALLAEIAAGVTTLEAPLEHRVHTLSAPVFRRDGRVALSLGMTWQGDTAPFGREHLDALLDAASAATATIGGSVPSDYIVSTP